MSLLLSISNHLDFQSTQKGKDSRRLNEEEAFRQWWNTGRAENFYRWADIKWRRELIRVFWPERRVLIELWQSEFGTILIICDCWHSIWLCGLWQCKRSYYNVCLIIDHSHSKKIYYSFQEAKENANEILTHCIQSIEC